MEMFDADGIRDWKLTSALYAFHVSMGRHDAA